MKIVANYHLGPMGVYEFGKGKHQGIHVMFASEKDNCGIVLYNRSNGAEIGRYTFAPEYKIGNVYCLTLENIALNKISYQFYEEGVPVIDKKSFAFAGKDIFGSFKSMDMYRSIITDNEYFWEKDKFPYLSYEESIGYCLHVRGFTMHKSSKVRGKGTFTGIMEKIPYLKELGITTLELQPAYEFAELPIITADTSTKEQAFATKLNYWGYKEGYYYMPKRAYAYTTDPSREFKDMVKLLHKNNMEVIMQFYFPNEFAGLEIISILRYWHTVYHVDGFHIKGGQLPVRDIAKDDFLSNAKLWYETYPIAEIYEKNSLPAKKRLGVYNDKYLCHVRGLLKCDEAILQPAVEDILENAPQYGVIKYLTNYYGFTMADMVTYQQKHNEANGEENLDGSNYNCTWNCGAEGNTRKKEVNELRKKQIYNAFALLFLSQGMPLFFMGDEFGNSQEGNNNPYCLDNSITWLDWNDLKKNQSLYQYVSGLIQFRKSHASLCYTKEWKGTDYLSLGYPDISFHGMEAWKLVWSKQPNCIGLLINEAYAEKGRKKFLYIAINMHWEKQKLALPITTREITWRLVMSSNTEAQHFDLEHDILDFNFCNIEPRSIYVLEGEL